MLKCKNVNVNMADDADNNEGVNQLSITQNNNNKCQWIGQVSKFTEHDLKECQFSLFTYVLNKLICPK